MGSNILRSVADSVGSVINAVPGGKYIGDAVALATGNPEFIPAIEGTSAVNKTGKLTSGLLSAGGSYLGGQLGGELFPDSASIGGELGSAANAVGAGDALSSGVASGLGSFAGNAVSNVLSTPVASALGGAIGSAAGSAIGGSKSNSAGASSFVPTQAATMALPGDLSQFGGLDPSQQESNIATQGVYGGGLGPDEQSYFNNLVNRQLTNSNRSTNPISNLSPIENSYLSQIGLGGYGNSNDLLQAMSTWTP